VVPGDAVEAAVPPRRSRPHVPLVDLPGKPGCAEDVFLRLEENLLDVALDIPPELGGEGKRTSERRRPDTYAVLQPVGLIKTKGPPAGLGFEQGGVEVNKGSSGVHMGKSKRLQR